MKSVELFTGAGGAALGLSRAGFAHQAVVELDEVACKTIRENRSRGVHDWPLHEEDVSKMDFASLASGAVELLAGGPPCQPFSIAGKRRAHGDERNMFPEVVRAVREIAPSAVFIENVPGLLFTKEGRYFDYILLQLRFPEIQRQHGERWDGHAKRLAAHAEADVRPGGVTYDVSTVTLQAADLGVPQLRQRVFIVAFRADLKVEWTFPAATHSLDALLWEQYVSEAYWDRHAIARKSRPEAPAKLAAKIAVLKSKARPSGLPWVTVRDALASLPEPAASDDDTTVPNHVFVPGARTYAKHTGSPLDLPAKTLKAGAHGVPGGENMLRRADGSVRYFTIRECARLQTFPDEYRFVGGWKRLARQLGNAVPVRLAELIGRSIHDRLVAQRVERPAARRRKVGAI